jgi:branched-chain amino acid transport system substrate-binding protein
LKKIVFLIIASLLVLGLVLPGCAGRGGGTTRPVTYTFPGQVIKIAIAGPMLTIQGLNMWWGASLAANQINVAGVNISGVNHTIQLIQVNTPVQTVKNAITVQGANFVMGGFPAGATAGMIEDAMNYNKMFFVAGADTGDLLKQVNNNYARYKYLFRATPLNETFMFVNTICMLAMVGHTINATLAGMAANITQPRVAFLAENLTWTQVLLAAVEEVVNALNYTFLGTWKVSDVTPTVAAELTAIQALKPHIIFTFLSGPVGLTYGKEMGSLNISAMSVGINVEGQDPGFWAATKVATKNWWGADGMMSLVTWAPNVNQTALTQPFLSAFQAATGQFPIYTAATYDMVLSLVKALEATATYNTTSGVASVKADDLIAWYENPANMQETTSGIAGFYPNSSLYRYLVTMGVPCYAHDLMYGPQWQTGIGAQWQNDGANNGITVGVWPKAEFAYPDAFIPVNVVLGLNWTGFEWPGTQMFTIPAWMIPIWVAY